MPFQGHGLGKVTDAEARPSRTGRTRVRGRRSAARPRPRRSGRRGLPDRSRPGSRSRGTGPARERGVCGPPTSVGLRPPFARRAAAAPWARLAPSGERGNAAFRRDFSRLGPGSRVLRGLDSPSQGHLLRPGCALAAEMAGVALRSGSGGSNSETCCRDGPGISYGLPLLFLPQWPMSAPA